MTSTEDLQDGAALEAWDWVAELERQERSIPWLARRTGRHQNTVYRYSWGRLRAPAEWLAEARRVLEPGRLDR